MPGISRSEHPDQPLHHRREPDHVPAHHPGAGADDRSVPAPGSGSVPRDQRGAPLLDPGCLHNQQLLSLRSARSRHGDLNYIRNSVKVVVDAYNGSVDFYLADPSDPIAATYQRAFPSLFKPLTAMPPDLQRHIRYPQDLFFIQAQVYRAYHMATPEVFYNREDLWQFPRQPATGTRSWTRTT